MRLRGQLILRGWFTEYYRELQTWAPPGFRDWPEHENKTATIREWSPMVITGMLQTEGYARAMLAVHPGVTDEIVDTVHRELREEIGQDLAGARLLCVLENIFQWHDAAQHEIVFVFAAAFADESAYDISGQEILDEPDGRTRVIWRPPDETSPPLYPVGVADLVARSG